MTIRLKSKDELITLREGGRRHAAILAELASRVGDGVSTLTLEEEAMRLIREYGDTPAFLGYTPQGARRAFPAALCVSINEEIVHGIPNEAERLLREGDIVSLDLGLIHNGLITDAAVTVGVGVIDDEAKRLIDTAKRALHAGCEAAKGGGHVGDIGAVISEVVRESGFSLAKDLAGHGVGYAVHEEPFVPNFGRRGEGELLTEGLVIAIEPMVNVGKPDTKTLSDGYTIVTKDGKRSAHFEHTVAITEKGNIILTS